MAMEQGHWNLSIEVTASVSDTLIMEMPLLKVFGSNRMVDDAEWKEAFAMGPERAFDQDPEYARRLLVDKALIGDLIAAPPQERNQALQHQIDRPKATITALSLRMRIKGKLRWKIGRGWAYRHSETNRL
jgi:hypothetical protein